MVFDIMFRLLMLIVGLLGSSHLNTNLKCYHLLCTSRISWKIFFELLLKFFAPIVGVNIPKIVFNLFAPLMVFFINLHVLIHHNRMVFLNVNIDT
jgi:hypothetical protein